MNDELTAAQKAALKSREELASTQPAVASSPPSGMSTVQEILQGYRQKQIELPHSKIVMEIQSLPPGDYLTVYGSALRAMMTAAGLDYEDDEKRTAYRANLSSEQRDAIANHNLRNYRRIVAKAVISIPISLDEQHLCDSGVLSVYQISDAEIIFINNEVDKLSGWSTDSDRFQRTVDDAKDGGAGKD